MPAQRLLLCVLHCLCVLQVRFEDCDCAIAPLLLSFGCQATLSGPSTATGNKGNVGFVSVTQSASLLIEGNLCASNNTGVVEIPELGQPAVSFASVAINSSLRVADSASVQVDVEGLDVFIGQSGDRPAGRLLCGPAAASSWQPGFYDITSNLCACSGEFQLGVEGQSRACDGCRGAGWDPELCA